MSGRMSKQNLPQEIEACILELKKEFDCPICHDLMKGPVVLKACDHKFCCECIQGVLGRRPSAACPVCKAAFTKRALLKPPAWSRLTLTVEQLMEAYQLDLSLQSTGLAHTPQPSQLEAPDYVTKRCHGDQSAASGDAELEDLSVAEIGLNKVTGTVSWCSDAAAATAVSAAGVFAAAQLSAAALPAAAAAHVTPVSATAPLSAAAAVSTATTAAVSVSGTAVVDRPLDTKSFAGKVTKMASGRLLQPLPPSPATIPGRRPATDPYDFIGSQPTPKRPGHAGRRGAVRARLSDTTIWSGQQARARLSDTTIGSGEQTDVVSKLAGDTKFLNEQGEPVVKRRSLEEGGSCQGKEGARSSSEVRGRMEVDVEMFVELEVPCETAGVKRRLRNRGRPAFTKKEEDMLAATSICENPSKTPECAAEIGMFEDVVTSKENTRVGRRARNYGRKNKAEDLSAVVLPVVADQSDCNEVELGSLIRRLEEAENYDLILSGQLRNERSQCERENEGRPHKKVDKLKKIEVNMISCVENIPLEDDLAGKRNIGLGSSSFSDPVKRVAMIFDPRNQVRDPSDVHDDSVSNVNLRTNSDEQTVPKSDERRDCSTCSEHKTTQNSVLCEPALCDKKILSSDWAAARRMNRELAFGRSRLKFVCGTPRLGPPPVWGGKAKRGGGKMAAELHQESVDVEDSSDTDSVEALDSSPPTYEPVNLAIQPESIKKRLSQSDYSGVALKKDDLSVPKFVADVNTAALSLNTHNLPSSSSELTLVAQPVAQDSLPISEDTHKDGKRQTCCPTEAASAVLSDPLKEATYGAVDAAQSVSDHGVVKVISSRLSASSESSCLIVFNGCEPLKSIDGVAAEVAAVVKAGNCEARSGTKNCKSTDAQVEDHSYAVPKNSKTAGAGPDCHVLQEESAYEIRKISNFQTSPVTVPCVINSSLGACEESSVVEVNRSEPEECKAIWTGCLVVEHTEASHASHSAAVVHHNDDPSSKSLTAADDEIVSRQMAPVAVSSILAGSNGLSTLEVLEALEVNKVPGVGPSDICAVKPAGNLAPTEKSTLPVEVIATINPALETEFVNVSVCIFDGVENATAVTEPSRSSCSLRSASSRRRIQRKTFQLASPVRTTSAASGCSDDISKTAAVEPVVVSCAVSLIDSVAAVNSVALLDSMAAADAAMLIDSMVLGDSLAMADSLSMDAIIGDAAALMRSLTKSQRTIDDDDLSTQEIEAQASWNCTKPSQQTFVSVSHAAEARVSNALDKQSTKGTAVAGEGVHHQGCPGDERNSWGEGSSESSILCALGQGMAVWSPRRGVSVSVKHKDAITDSCRVNELTVSAQAGQSITCALSAEAMNQPDEALPAVNYGVDGGLKKTKYSEGDGDHDVNASFPSALILTESNTALSSLGHARSDESLSRRRSLEDRIAPSLVGEQRKGSSCDEEHCYSSASPAIHVRSDLVLRDSTNLDAFVRLPSKNFSAYVESKTVVNDHASADCLVDTQGRILVGELKVGSKAPPFCSEVLHVVDVEENILDVNDLAQKPWRTGNKSLHELFGEEQAERLETESLNKSSARFQKYITEEEDSDVERSPAVVSPPCRRARRLSAASLGGYGSSGGDSELITTQIRDHLEEEVRGMEDEIARLEAELAAAQQVGGGALGAGEGEGAEGDEGEAEEKEQQQEIGNADVAEERDMEGISGSELKVIEGELEEVKEGSVDEGRNIELSTATVDERERRLENEEKEDELRREGVRVNGARIRTWNKVHEPCELQQGSLESEAVDETLDSTATERLNVDYERRAVSSSCVDPVLVEKRIDGAVGGSDEQCEARGMARDVKVDECTPVHADTSTVDVDPRAVVDHGIIAAEFGLSEHDVVFSDEVIPDSLEGHGNDISLGIQVVEQGNLSVDGLQNELVDAGSLSCCDLELHALGTDTHKANHAALDKENNTEDNRHDASDYSDPLPPTAEVVATSSVAVRLEINTATTKCASCVKAVLQSEEAASVKNRSHKAADVESQQPADTRLEDSLSSGVVQNVQSVKNVKEVQQCERAEDRPSDKTSFAHAQHSGQLHAAEFSEDSDFVLYSAATAQDLLMPASSALIPEHNQERLKESEVDIEPALAREGLSKTMMLMKLRSWLCSGIRADEEEEQDLNVSDNLPSLSVVQPRASMPAEHDESLGSHLQQVYESHLLTEADVENVGKAKAKVGSVDEAEAEVVGVGEAELDSDEDIFDCEVSSQCLTVPQTQQTPRKSLATFSACGREDVATNDEVAGDSGSPRSPSPPPRHRSSEDRAECVDKLPVQDQVIEIKSSSEVDTATDNSDVFKLRIASEPDGHISVTSHVDLGAEENSGVVLVSGSLACRASTCRRKDLSLKRDESNLAASETGVHLPAAAADELKACGALEGEDSLRKFSGASSLISGEMKSHGLGVSRASLGLAVELNQVTATEATRLDDKDRPSDAVRAAPVIFPQNPNWVFVVSGSHRTSEETAVAQLARRLGCRVSSRFTYSTTHVLVKQIAAGSRCCLRTLKYFQAVAHRRWVVAIDWAVDCIRSNLLLPTEDYEITSDSALKYVHRGPMTARLATELPLRRYEICCLGAFHDITRDDLSELAEVCGASAVQDPAMFMFDPSLTQVIVVEDPTPSTLSAAATGAGVDSFSKWTSRYQAAVVKKEWLLDSVGTYTVKPVEPYLVIKELEHDSRV